MNNNNNKLNINQHIQSYSIDQLYSVQNNYYDNEDDNSEEEESEEDFPVYIPKHQLTKRQENISNEIDNSITNEDEENIIKQNQQYVHLSLQHQPQLNSTFSDESTEDFTSGEEFGDEEEFIQWQDRELQRLKKEYIELLTYRRDLKTLEEINSFTQQNNIPNTSINQNEMNQNEQEKTQYKFMQKYYHIGSFFRDGGEWDVSRGKWDFDAATGDDWMDKLALPKILQTKQMGKKGRSKHTNLKDEDTTYRNYE